MQPKMLTVLKKKINHLLNRAFYLEPQIGVSTKFLGTDYGGWWVAPEYLNKNAIIYSFGIGQDISFDLELIQNFNLKIHGFDPTPKSIQWVKSQDLPKEFVLHEYGLAAQNGDLLFNPPSNPDHVSLSQFHFKENQKAALKLTVKNLETIMQDLGHQQVDLIKMDIEGSEYEVIEALQKTNIRPKQLLIEFHHRFPEIGIKKTKQACKQIENMGYKLFATSDRQEEFSFLHQSK